MPDPLGEAVAGLRDGGLVAYPTETVWGLAADATSDAAQQTLRAWKGRGDHSPVSILLENVAELGPLEFEFGGGARRLAQAFWPGPITLVLTCRRHFALGVAREDGAVGVRCSSHPLAMALARRCRSEGVGPITATSLNRSGDAPARTWEEARSLCEEGGVQLLNVEGAEAGADRETTVIDVSGAQPEVLRWGALEEDVAPVLRELRA